MNEPAHPAQTSAAGPPPAGARWTVLVLVSVALFGNYYVYDAVAPLADHLQRLLGFTDTQIGTLNAIYSVPNILMVLIGGIIVDRIGGTFLLLLVFPVLAYTTLSLWVSTVLIGVAFSLVPARRNPSSRALVLVELDLALLLI